MHHSMFLVFAEFVINHELYCDVQLIILVILFNLFEREVYHVVKLLHKHNGPGINDSLLFWDVFTMPLSIKHHFYKIVWHMVL